MRPFEIFRGLFQFVQKSLGQFRLFLVVNRFLGRSLDQTGDAPGIVVMRLRNLGDGGLNFDSKPSNSAFLSAGIFPADSIADLVLSMCSSIIARHRAYFSSQERPSVKIFTSLPPFCGFTKIVSAASPRFRFSIEEAGVTRSLPSLVQPWALRFAANSAQTLFTFVLLLKRMCSTSSLYSTSDASFVRARSLTLSLSCAGSGAAFSLSSVVALVAASLSVASVSTFSESAT